MVASKKAPSTWTCIYKSILLLNILCAIKLIKYKFYHRSFAAAVSVNAPKQIFIKCIFLELTCSYILPKYTHAPLKLVKWTIIATRICAASTSRTYVQIPFVPLAESLRGGEGDEVQALFRSILCFVGGFIGGEGRNSRCPPLLTWMRIMSSIVSWSKLQSGDVTLLIAKVALDSGSLEGWGSSKKQDYTT